jgi:hypothetical protein
MSQSLLPKFIALIPTSPAFIKRVFIGLASVSFSLLLVSCSAKPEFRSSCANESDAAWQELSLAKAKGFGGTVSYAKALSLLTAARTMQVAENFDACYDNARKARKYIGDSYKGQ